MILKRSVPLALLAAVLMMMFLVSSSGGSAQEVKRNGLGIPTCVKAYKASDFKPIASRAWRRPNAPTKKYLNVFHTVYSCAENNKIQRLITKINKKYKKMYERLRLLKKAEAKCSNSSPIDCIKYASLKESYSYSTLIRIASCETTGYDPYAVNSSSGATGLFQFMYSTFADVLARAGWGNKSITSAKWNSLAAAWKMKRDGTHEWACA